MKLSFWQVAIATLTFTGIMGAIFVWQVSEPPPKITPIPMLSNDEISVLLNDPTMYNRGKTNYTLRCSSCHGFDAKGESAPSLLDTDYKGNVNGIISMIQYGNPSKGMPAFGQSIFQDDIKAIAAYVYQLNQKSIDRKLETK